MDDSADIEAKLAWLQAIIDRSPVDADGFLDGEMRAAQELWPNLGDDDVRKAAYRGR